MKVINWNCVFHFILLAKLQVWQKCINIKENKKGKIVGNFGDIDLRVMEDS